MGEVLVVLLSIALIMFLNMAIKTSEAQGTIQNYEELTAKAAKYSKLCEPFGGLEGFSLNGQVLCKDKTKFKEEEK